MGYIMEKHGREHTANIATFGRLQTKAVIKDVAKAMGIPFEEVNGFTKLLPSGPGANISISDIIVNDEYSAFVNKYPDLFEYAEKLEGSPRHVSQHAAGMVVSPPEYPLWSLIPLQRGKEVAEGVEAGYLTQVEKSPVEQLGLVKFDILGLKNVTELHEQFKMINNLYSKTVNFDDIPLDDKKTWDLIGKGNTLGVFQFASALAISVITKIKPVNLEELSAANAFIRPGASGLDEYLAAKKDSSKRRKLHPKLDPILEPTYGSIVYQEQIMGLIATIMDIDFGEADKYRRMLEKPKKFPEEIKKWKIEFKELGLKHGFSDKLIALLMDLIIENSGYGFNKSHAISYSLISYWTAYMKANFPLVFYMTMLNGNQDEADSFIAEARKLDIEVLPPHVNNSKLEFTIEEEVSENNGGKIRGGFNIVKGVGPKAVDTIVENQPYVSIDDFQERTSGAVNKKVWEALVKFGALENLGVEIQNEDISEEIKENIKLKEVFDNEHTKLTVVLNRKQLSKWYETYQEESNKKAPPNFIVPEALIPGKYLNDQNYELEEEKDGSGYVIPGDWLKTFKINEKLVDKTRKRPKGMFKQAKSVSKVPAFRKAFQDCVEELLKIEMNEMDVYLEESSELGFSFLAHPLEKHMNKIDSYDEKQDGELMTTAGIVEAIIQRWTKNNKPFYWVMIKTPREKVRVTLWDNQLKQYEKFIKKQNVVVVRGTKGFGGMNVDSVKLIDTTKL